jgi:hypothetical protein
LSSLIFVTAGVAAIGAALPALGQQGPESLLPPGFGDPPPPPPPPPAARPPAGQQGPSTPSGATGQGSTGATPSTSGSKSADAKDDGDDEEVTEIRYDVPPTARRSLKQVGIMAEANGGFPATAFGNVRGSFLMDVARKTKGPLASRWGTIMTRRLLASRTNTPSDINGADWVAERGALILRMGDAVVARQLVQQVDSGSYTPRLLQVSMPIFLANADLAGMCPLAEGGSQRTESPEWKTALSVCASLAGEQARATSLLSQVRNKGWVKGIDYLLTEKAVGAGTNGRRTVKIEWDKVTSMTNWRHGMAQATGIEPPEALYANMGRQVDGWRVQLPMVSAKTRVTTATGAAALGVLSNRAMVDAFGLAAEDPDIAADISTKADYVRTAFVGGSDRDKISAMQSLWGSAADERARHGMLVLTARAAALIAPNAANAGDADRLVASMLTGGFDTQAARWLSLVDEGSLAWALLATGSPDWPTMVDSGAIDDFQGNDNSEEYHKTALLIAGLGGLGRISGATLVSTASDIEVNVTKETPWTRAIRDAASRGESGTVALLAAAGLQATDWTKVPPHHLYHMVAALRTVGLEAEARMIAAEAVSFG